MKKLMIPFLIFLSGCYAPWDNCDLQQPFRAYHYGDKVEVIAGFYKGSTGYILGQHYVYQPNNCNTPAFEVDLYNPNIGQYSEKTISQYELYVKESK